MWPQQLERWERAHPSILFSVCPVVLYDDLVEKARILSSPVHSRHTGPRLTLEAQVETKSGPTYPGLYMEQVWLYSLSSRRKHFPFASALEPATGQ